MALIPDREKAELKRAFRTELKGDVVLRLFTQKPSLITIPGRECRYCGETQQLMEEVVALSPKLHLEVYDFYSQTEERKKYDVERIPAILLGGGEASRLKFYGIPMGHEFATVLQGIKTLSRGVSPLTMDSRKKLRRVNQRVHIQVFVTPNGETCPQVASLAHAIALENSNVTADVVEIGEFPNLAQVYTVRSVPKTVINEVIQFEGAIAESDFIDKVIQAGAREPEGRKP